MADHTLSNSANRNSSTAVTQSEDNCFAKHDRVLYRLRWLRVRAVAYSYLLKFGNLGILVLWYKADWLHALCGMSFSLMYYVVPKIEEISAEAVTDEHQQKSPRCICSIYTLNPLARPEMHRIICVMLALGHMTDNDIKSFISQHVETAIVPRCIQDDVEMCTTNFAIQYQTETIPPFLQQLIDFCSSPSAISFDDPIFDGTGARISFLSLSSSNWQETLDVTLTLGHCINEDALHRINEDAQMIV